MLVEVSSVLDFWLIEIFWLVGVLRRLITLKLADFAGEALGGEEKQLGSELGMEDC